MVNLSCREVARLFECDSMLRGEADHVLEASGLAEILQGGGYRAVGSYVMRTMAWRDLDFERTEEPPDWERHWKLGARLAKSPWVWKFSCANAYKDPAGTGEGLYWGLRLSDPAGGATWKIDLWTARAEEFAAAMPNRARWDSMLDDESRAQILAIKEAVCGLPEYRHSMLSVQIYEAVLDHGIRGVQDFMEWWRTRYR